MKVYEIFDRDPRTERLANNGQARITDQTDAKAIAELRAELETFVCEGQFARAIQLILEQYLGNLSHTKQHAAWVSGFFGSGKSHLLKMLAHLWVNTEFEDGSTARSLVGGGLPDEIQAQLRELDIRVTRSGLPAVSAAGTLLGGTDRVRETVLSILLRATGWPEQYPQARFCFWLREQGWLDTVRSAVEAERKDWLHELNNLYVSPHLRRALLQADPNLASSEKEVGKVLQSHCPQLTSDITTSQFTETAKLALIGADGAFPLTLLVLDEVQQYINEASDRAAIITEVAEALQTQFDSRVMLVGAGQSALSASTPALMWLRDRFTISIELADADVEAVTRKVLLHKKPSAEPKIEAMLDTNAGEIARQLQGTKIGDRPEDRRHRVGDYPLLPTRRRFWESCFQAADAAGTHSQLRSQLRILHDSLHDVAGNNLGAVIPASDLFNALAPSLVNTGVLLNEINTRIQRLDDGTDDGRLGRDLCGLVFLIGKLPREAGVDLGVRATTTALADLMVDDVTKDSGPFRNRVTTLLEKLAADGTLMQVGDEYRLQTTEGAEWDRAYRERQAALRQNEIEVSTRRDHLFGHEVQTILGEIKLTHGEAKLRRSLTLHVGSEPPKAGGDHIIVWMRDGWSCAYKDVPADARRLGQEDPTLHVHLPKKSDDDLRARIIDVEAARQVIEHYGRTTTPEGDEARESMESRLRVAEASRDEIVHDIIRASKVVQGGGTEVFGDNLAEKIRTGAEASLDRLYGRFDDGDHRAWGAAVKRSKEGSDEPFKVVGWTQATEDHPVAKEMLNQIGTGTRGSEVQKTLIAPPFGWPQDAIDAALLALHRSGHLHATKNGQPVPVGALDQTAIKTTEFRPQKVRLTTTQRITVRGLFSDLAVNTKSGEEELKAPVFLDTLIQLAESAGGDPPLPPVPDTRLLEELDRLTGAEQLSAILEHEKELRELLRLCDKRAGLVRERMPVWETVNYFQRHAGALPVHEEIAGELEAIREQRSLLKDSDYVSILAKKLASELRNSLTKLHAELGQVVQKAHSTLDADATWSKVPPEGRQEILEDVGLSSPGSLSISTDKELRLTLDDRPLSSWQAAIDAVPQRVANALALAAERLETDGSEAPITTVVLRRGTLPNEPAVREWLSEHEAKLLEAVAKGAVIVQ